MKQRLGICKKRTVEIPGSRADLPSRHSTAGTVPRAHHTFGGLRKYVTFFFNQKEKNELLRVKENV